MRREGEVGGAADGDPYHGEQDRVGDRQPLGQRQQQADQPEQGGNGKDSLDGLRHDGRLWRTYRQLQSATRRTAPDSGGRRFSRRLTGAAKPR